MKNPRFTVGSVTGWAIRPGTSSQAHTATSIWYVLDSCWCHHEVATFRGWPSVNDRYDRALIGRRTGGEKAEQFARRYAAALEEEYGE